MPLVTGTGSTFVLTSNAVATNFVWRTWMNGGTGSATTCAHAYLTNAVTDPWAFASTTTGTSCTEHVWRTWQTMPHESRTRVEHVATWARPAVPADTPEVIADRARRREEADRLARADRERRAAASKRARGLLMQHLTREQRESYEKHGHFDVQLEGKTYRIKQGTHGNVSLVDDKGPIERYCVQPDGVPTEDAMLAQLLTLRHAPHEFFGKANTTRIRN